MPWPGSSFGTTVPVPPNVGTVKAFLADNLTNRGSSSTTTAWAFYKQLVGQVVPAALNDLSNIPQT